MLQDFSLPTLSPIRLFGARPTFNNSSATLAGLLLTLMLAFQLNGQDRVRLSLGAIATDPATNGCVTMTADSFPDLVAVQFSLSWDPSIVTFNAVDLGANPVGFSQSNFFSPNDSTLNLSWISTTGAGVTLPFGTAIFSVCFSPVGPPGTTTITFAGGLPNEFIQEDLTLLPSTLNDGSYTVIPAPPTDILVLPGDTNQDSLVSADDLLNIGLAFNATGPARPTPQSDFSFQPASSWNLTTANGTDYAHLDTDGNGLIDEQDVLVLEENYGQSFAGFQAQVTGSAAVSTPTITLAPTGDIIGGQTTALRLFVGDQVNPSPPGYGLSLALNLDPEVFDLSTLSVDFNDNYLGSDLLTFSGILNEESGLIELAASRKDLLNTVETHGLFATLTITPRVFGADRPTSISVAPYRFINAAQDALGVNASTTSLTVFSPVGIGEPGITEKLVLSPNPVARGTFITISSNEAVPQEAIIFHANGKLVRRIQLAGEHRIDLAELSAGTYFLHIRHGGSTSKHKLIIVN